MERRELLQLNNLRVSYREEPYIRKIGIAKAKGERREGRGWKKMRRERKAKV